MTRQRERKVPFNYFELHLLFMPRGDPKPLEDAQRCQGPLPVILGVRNVQGAKTGDG